MSIERQIIARVANIGVSDGNWGISDSDGDLRLIHYRMDADEAKYGHIRGIVIDVKAGVVVCRSYPSRPKATAKSLELNKEGFLCGKDENDTPYKIDGSKMAITQGYEGTLIRIFKHNNKVYYTTHRRLDITRSRWGSSKTFKSMYDEMKGPSESDIFSNNAYSPFVHLFFMVHPDLLICSKEEIGRGHLIYMGYREMGKLPFNDVEKSSSYNMKGDVHIPRALTLEQANQHLATGFHPKITDIKDPFLANGEFVVVRHGDEYLTIRSHSYRWRCAMRDNDPSLYHRFVMLIGSVDKDDFTGALPILNHHSKEALLAHLPIITWPEGGAKATTTSFESCVKYVWSTFIMAVPLNKQREAIDLHDRYIKDSTALIDWLVKLALDAKSDLGKMYTRVSQIIQHAKQQLGNSEIDKGAMRDTVGNILALEDIGSYYKLIREMRNQQRVPISAAA